jgi:dCMP deaminase
MDLAYHISGWSKDPSTRVGCVVTSDDRKVLSTGYNGFPEGVEDSVERLNDRELKNALTVHAEENAIAQAALFGVSLRDSILFCTFAPCARCAASIAQAGVATVVYPQERPDIKAAVERWKGSQEIGEGIIFAEKGIEVIRLRPHDATRG